MASHPRVPSFAQAWKQSGSASLVVDLPLSSSGKTITTPYIAI